MAPKIPDESPAIAPDQYSHVWRMRWVPCRTCAATGLREHIAYAGLPPSCPDCGGLGKTVDFVRETVAR